MNPNYMNTITLFRKKDGAWEKTVLHHCFWKCKIESAQNGTEVNKVNTYTVRIPMKEEGLVVHNGDIVILGDCQEEITMKSPNTATEILSRNKPNAFVVTAYADNTGHFLDKHYRLGG